MIESVVRGSREFLQRHGWDLVRDTFTHRFMYTIRRLAIDTVIDVGANTGQFAQSLRSAGYRGTILSLEPLQSAYQELERNSRADDSWTALPFAVAARSGAVTMNIAANSVSSSLLPMLDAHERAAPDALYVGKQEAIATTVDALVAEHGIEPSRSLLKVDVQGFERSVFEGASQALRTFAGVRCELSLTPLYDNQALLPEIVSDLSAYGLELWFLERGFSDDHSRRLLQLDGSFFRTPSPIE